jgi:hypothetical protein
MAVGLDGVGHRAGRCYQSIPRPGHHAEETHPADVPPLMEGPSAHAKATMNQAINIS